MKTRITQLTVAPEDQPSAEGRARYWKQRAKSAEGHLWGGDFAEAAKSVHAEIARTVEGYPSDFDDLSATQRARIHMLTGVVIRTVNGLREKRLPPDDVD